MKRFIVYRPNPPENYVREGYALPPEQIQIYGVVTPQGKCIIEWQTAVNSVSIFASFDEFMKIHGHPDYGTIVKWLDKDEEDYVYDCSNGDGWKETCAWRDQDPCYCSKCDCGVKRYDC